MRNTSVLITKVFLALFIVGSCQVSYAAKQHKHKATSKSVMKAVKKPAHVKPKVKKAVASRLVVDNPAQKAIVSGSAANQQSSAPAVVAPAPEAKVAEATTESTTETAATTTITTAPTTVSVPAAAVPTVAATPVPTPDAPVAASPSVPVVVPAAPNFDLNSYILIDANSGYVMAEKNSKLRAAPASLTKIMTLYLAAEALRNGKIHLTDPVVVSENAWRTGGSRMFIKVGTQVLVQDLIKGIAIASGNDAAVAMAEHLAGSEQSFIGLMNQAAHSLKMDGTNFADSNGLPHVDNYSTAADLAILAKAWIANYPDYYSWFRDKWITYNGIKQPNRNRLLWRDPSVDGMKTGHTEDAGYCLVSSAVRNGMRLIAVVMGAKNDATRTNGSMALLNYGFRFFETRKLFAVSTPLASPRTFLGKQNHTALGVQEDFYVTLPVGQHQNLKAKATVQEKLKAPIIKGQVCGSIDILADNKVIATKPLVAINDNPKANFIFAIFDYIIMLFNR